MCLFIYDDWEVFFNDDSSSERYELTELFYGERFYQTSQEV